MTNYDKAKLLLRRNKAVLVKYYNTYSKTRTLKVLYWGETVTDLKRANRLHKQLSALALQVKRSNDGRGDIYVFRKDSK